MGLFLGARKESIRVMQKKARYEAKGGFVNPRDYSYLDRELRLYAKQNDCGYDDAARVSNFFDDDDEDVY